MAEALIPEIVPGLVAVEFVGKEVEGGPKKGAVKNVFPIDAKEMLMSREYKLVENGSVEAARLNANPLRRVAADPRLVVTEVTGIEGQVHVAASEADAKEAIEAGDHDGESAPKADTQPVATTPQPGKAPGTPTGAKSESDKK